MMMEGSDPESGVQIGPTLNHGNLFMIKEALKHSNKVVNSSRINNF